MTPRTVSLTQRGFNLETIMWAFTRLSALAMYACALIGLVGALIMGARMDMNMADLMRWMFMPNPNHVLNTNVPDLAPWSTLFWKIMGTVFVCFATSHGLRGLMSVLEDYVAKKWARWTIRTIILVLMAAMIFVGVYLIWTA